MAQVPDVEMVTAAMRQELLEPDLRRVPIVDPGVDLREKRGAGCDFWLPEPDRDG
jgi:hypothetical protein